MPNILVFDIETSPIIALVWGMYDQNLAPNQVIKDTGVIAFAAKWYGAPASEVTYMDTRILRERTLLIGIRALLDRADYVITQNGKNFDSLRLNARFIALGMRPPKSHYRHLDTLLISKRVAKFTSHKLEYMSDKLCTKYKKLKHTKFPGLELWIECCLKNNRAAWEEMRRYNIRDVLATEELYNKLKPWEWVGRQKQITKRDRQILGMAA